MEEKRLEQLRREQEQREQQEQQLREEEQMKLARSQEKIQRETQKKLIRKAKQILRRNLSSLYERQSSSSSHWNDTYDMNQDIDFLCSTVSVEEMNQYNDQFESHESGGSDSYLTFIFQEVQKHKNNPPAMTVPSSVAPAEVPLESPERRTWSATELSALTKALKKYPAVGAGRWEAICTWINHSTGASPPFTKEECIEKYNVTVRSKSTTNDSAPRPVTPGEEDDSWTAEQDQALQEALAQYPATMDKNERWTAIAARVSGKNKKSCVQRFKAIRELLSNQQQRNNK